MPRGRKTRAVQVASAEVDPRIGAGSLLYIYNKSAKAPGYGKTDGCSGDGLVQVVSIGREVAQRLRSVLVTA